MSRISVSPVRSGSPAGVWDRTGREPAFDVVMFAGGSGARTITQALIARQDISLTILINAYDDGLSTGTLRAFVPGFLGPSDVRKNIVTLLDPDLPDRTALAALLDNRLPDNLTSADGLAIVEALGKFASEGLPSVFASSFRDLTPEHAAFVADSAHAFASFARERERSSECTFEFSDCSLGNLVLAGCFLTAGRDFNRMIAVASERCGLRGRILNVTDGQPLHLVALKADGELLTSEAAIVGPQSTLGIRALFLLPDRPGPDWLVELASLDVDTREKRLQSRSVLPSLWPPVARALADASLIVYGPGTPHSSLFPSYLTEGLATAIASNRRAPKVLIGNLRVDHDSQSETASTLIDKTLLYLRSRSPSSELRDDDLVTHAFAHRPASGAGRADTLTFEPWRSSVQAQLNLIDWEDPSNPGRHSGPLVLDELLRLCAEWPDRPMQTRAMQTLSIVIPAYNEARFIGELIDRVIAVDLRHHGVDKEIIVIDDASSDETGAIARARPGVRVLTQPVNRGKGAAVRRGIEEAAGDWILIQDADLEYDPNDIHKMVSAAINGQFQAVYGSRNLRGDQKPRTLAFLYGKRDTQYWGHYLGGVVLSLATLALYGRYLTDTVTGYKLYAAPLVKSFRLTSTGFELDHEITANLLRRGVDIFEVPASYDPRSWAEGKKIRARDGFIALWTLLRCRVARG
jgi:2-phospho-L-lactate transferase/gluconeogenesis factor (CofD/UPF0052 family)